MITLPDLSGTLHHALRNVVRQRARTGLTLAAIALGVASLILIGGYVEDILIQLREATIHSRLGHLQVVRPIPPGKGGARGFEQLIEDPALVERAVGSLKGVIARGRRLEFSGLLSNGRADIPIIGEAVEPVPEARIGTSVSILTGRRLGAGDVYSIVVGEGLASAMRLRVGDSVNIVLGTRDGAMNALEFTVVGVSRSFSKEYDARAVQIPLPAGAELIDTPAVSSIVVLLDDTNATDAARAALAAQLPAARFEVKTWKQLADFYNNTAALYERQFAVLQLIVLVMVLLSVANTVNMTLHERTSEFGTMRALGRRGRDIFWSAVTETAVLGVVGAALGVVLGVGLAIVVSAIGIAMPPPPNSEVGFTAAIRVVPSGLLVAFLVGTFGAVLASLLPARRIARVPIVDALRQAL